jgi:primosomal protein N'
VPCPIERIQGETRWHILLKGKTRAELRRMLAASRPEAAAREGVRVAVDVDPLSLL